ncbi:DUF58 domain-containing protein [Demequina salsinemoris]|uniref:DUF58 domain-containing protein n=1 Tax=Demequina salsinemoris TaxID=577470 RepID=UPI000785203C|nr:DUF58 domain-containing protein [Demequina salsinemoris]
MPTDVPERLLTGLEWRLLHRVDGRLQGGHRTSQRGSGMDVADVRPYADGDEARRIDWAVTARLDETHVRRYDEDREVTAWLVLDRSASMRFGAEGRGKDDALAGIAVALTRLLGSTGDRVSALLYDDQALRVIQPGSGRHQSLLLTRELRAAAPAGTPGTPTDLRGMLRVAAATARRRGLVIVVSDLVGQDGWQRELSLLARRHEVALIRVVDPLERELPELGPVVMEDSETGEQVLVDVSDPGFRARFAAEIAREDALLAEAARAARVDLHTVSTADSLADVLVRIVRSTAWRRA